MSRQRVGSTKRDASPEDYKVVCQNCNICGGSEHKRELLSQVIVLYVRSTHANSITDSRKHLRYPPSCPTTSICPRHTWQREMESGPDDPVGFKRTWVGEGKEASGERLKAERGEAQLSSPDLWMIPQRQPFSHPLCSQTHSQNFNSKYVPSNCSSLHFSALLKHAGKRAESRESNSRYKYSTFHMDHLLTWARAGPHRQDKLSSMKKSS